MPRVRTHTQECLAQRPLGPLLLKEQTCRQRADSEPSAPGRAPPSLGTSSEHALAGVGDSVLNHKNK